jgi:hypothetical protein
MQSIEIWKAPSLRACLQQRKSIRILEGMIPIGKIPVVLFGIEE